ncbi:acetyl-CoA hydrolase/transferase family protein [Bordetella petrii]|uniref:acetyl-CoA hydrolase/transferase family protein n=1 Tax=Bordetella petrii TaxID=94624 RepID=UPI001E2E9F68|nr:acetyl-CoA hydrolase/transferase C-terminal domain-containing protein [Bordetella petrii]MCD0501774.1 acetyl-CoA hydrolase [Bordetella petrii]
MRSVAHVEEFLAGMAADECVVVHSGAAHPTVLSRQLAESARLLDGHRVHVLLPYGPVPYAQAPALDRLEIATFLPGAGLRPAMDVGRLLALRQPLSHAPALFGREKAVGAVLLRVSPPDGKGRVSLGVSVDYMPAALRRARLVIAEIDPSMPRVCGDGWISAGRIDAFVHAEDGPHEVHAAPADAIDDAIANHVAGLLEDGSVLQLGVGALPDRVLAKLGHLRHLGLHTGIIGDAAVDLIARGIIDNSAKEIRPGVSVATMAVGSSRLYTFLDGNAAVELHPCSITHDSGVLGHLHSLNAINAALQVDLDGRVNAEWAGARQVSLPGGLPDFSRAAASSPKGRSIIALRSLDRQGRSTIVPSLPANRPSSLEPEDVDCYVTEHGVAAVRGCYGDARRRALIAIAHPEHRDALMRA